MNIVAFVLSLLCVAFFAWGLYGRAQARDWRRRATVATTLLRRATVPTSAPNRTPDGRPWRCSVCGEMFGLADRAAHEHADDPRSDYYVPSATTESAK